ncbi:MAG: trypsin-like peptidase domain-containing protein [Spirochaetaceae bacterium]|jgi:Do/DeqQ family serine protease|nr:trypsin-like peptidase domain-containing protein [Spirochaetaceae bacterium]
MSVLKKLSSKNFFIFNLVLIGAIFGFSFAFLSFTCTSPQSKLTVKAQENSITIPASALETAESIQTVFRAIADKVIPSVVELKTVSVRRQETPNFPGIPFEFFFGPQQPGESGREFRSQGLGSGIIVRQQNDTYFVLTNNHVVTGGGDNPADEIRVAAGGNEYPAELVAREPRRDLAMVKFNTPDKLPLAVLGDSDLVDVGDWAIAVGNPLAFESSVTMGIVSAVGRTGGPGDNINDFIQTDAAINQGNSGGALVNIRGEVIGINMWIASSTGGGSMGLGFAIPINNAKTVIDEFIDKGEVSDGWLGVSLLDIDGTRSEDMGFGGRQGAFASGVFLDSPAAKAGIQAGDFITAVDGREMRSSRQLTRVVADLKAGEKHVFTVFRDNKTVDLNVTIAVRNNEIAAENGKLWPGLFVVPLSDKIRIDMQITDDKINKGLVVIQVIDKSPAAIIGIQRRDIVTAVNGEAVNDLNTFYRILREKAGKELWFDFSRSGNNLETMRFKR